MAVRFYGCAEYHLATVLHAYDGELVDVILMDGSDHIERVEETMLRQVDQKKAVTPSDSRGRGFLSKR